MNKITTEELAALIKATSNNHTRFLVAISGFGGAGKSTVSEQLANLLCDATLIHTDDFIDADDNGAREGYHLNWEILEGHTIKPARTAGELTSRIYDWKTNKRIFQKISPRKYIIIEGSIWLMQSKFKQYFDLTVWIDVPQNIANTRGKKRDNEEYGVNHDELWDKVWGPRENDSFNKLRPNINADLLLTNYF